MILKQHAIKDTFSRMLEPELSFAFKNVLETLRYFTHDFTAYVSET